MAKTKTPFLSLGARGTIGKAVTYQEGKAGTIIRAKPLPAYRRTLPQVYQRWDYQDGIALWETLSDATKSQWRAVGSRKHLTAFQAFMSNYLTHLPDLIARYTLDERVGAITYDTSKGGHHGTIFGASPATGIIDQGRYFDGLNDHIQVPHHPDLNLNLMTICAFFKPENIIQAYHVIVAKLKDDFSLINFILYGGLADVYFACKSGGVWKSATAVGILQADTWIHLAGTYDGTNLKLYADGALKATTPQGTPDLNTFAMSIGRRNWPVSYAYTKGVIDQVRLNNRVLTQPHIQRISERSYSVE